MRTTSRDPAPRPRPGTGARVHRHRRRHPVAAAIAALPLAAGLLVATAPPARANDCGMGLPCLPDIPSGPPIWEPWFPPPIDWPVFFPDMPPPPPTEAPPGLVVEEARSDALAALIVMPGCNALVSGPNPAEGKDAYTRVPTTHIAIRTDRSIENGREVVARAIPTTVLPHARIDVFPPFYGAPPPTGPGVTWDSATDRTMMGGGSYRTPPTRDQLRAAILLHEIAHLTGGMTHPQGDPHGEFNKRVLDVCFGVRETPVRDVIRPPRGGGPIP